MNNGQTAQNLGDNDARAEIAIGPHRLRGRAILAPMSGVSDHAMRRVAQDFGASLVVSEMVAADQLVMGAEEARLRSEGAGIATHVVQLAGCEALPMAEGARIAAWAGADVIDINMGCPARKVVNGWSGSALMRDLDHACRLIAAVSDAVDVPVTLKMRLGWDEHSINAPELARRAEALGVRMITVHGRTRAQFYKGAADWAAIRAVKSVISCPLIVNGDITSLCEAQTALAHSGADGVMIGRAALGRPWLVGAIAAGLAGVDYRAPAPAAMAQAALAHYEGLLSAFGRAHGVRHARKHIAAYAEEAARHGAMIGGAERDTALQSEDPRMVIAFLEAIFSRIPTLQAA